MYNRYIRNDRGGYTRIPEEEPRPARPQEPPRPESPPEPEHVHRPPPEPEKSAGAFADGLSGLLRHLLDQFHLDNVDTGDLLLLLLLFLLFQEEADEELLFALGLLLIL